MAPTTNLLLTDLMSGVNHIPSNYIRPISDRPNLTAFQVSDASSIPLIDLKDLHGPTHSDNIKQIGLACQTDGFFQVISNNRYKSVLRRAVVNCNSERISIPTFYCPSPDAVIGPAKELVNYDHPAMYRNCTYAEYYEKFWNKGLATECCLDLFKPI
ncbi:hypothetical protein C1H46_001449 [Malus baccata]|uniref:Non-haem dioxygenase N-terminal domain-containing protein n=1 Tax=Malus baccata TaxID=106549 RepID=A0A540NQB3_MALBA|nr:hypothetical protein C1H46_001449 [Malus baccata]